MVYLTMSIWKINVEYVCQDRMDIPQYHFVGLYNLFSHTIRIREYKQAKKGVESK
jgi:hypothetical protein